MSRWTALSDRDYGDEDDRWRGIVACHRCGQDAPLHEGESPQTALCDRCWREALTTQIQKADRGVA